MAHVMTQPSLSSSLVTLMASRLHNAMRPRLRAGGDGVYAARRYDCERSRPPAGNPSPAGAPRPDNASCALSHDHQTPDHRADDRGDEGPADDLLCVDLGGRRIIKKKKKQTKKN